MMIKVLLVENNEVVRIGLRAVLNRSPTIQVVGEVGAPSDIKNAVCQTQPHVVLLGFCCVEGPGLRACREIVADRPGTRIIFLTAIENQNSTLAAVLAGASGYLQKEINPSRLLQAIEMVADGHSILDQNVTLQVKDLLKPKRLIGNYKKKNRKLSQQQHRVLTLLSDGKTNREIAEDLGLSEKTVRNYLAVIYEKLQVTRRTQAVAVFAKNFT